MIKQDTMEREFSKAQGSVILDNSFFSKSWDESGESQESEESAFDFDELFHQYLVSLI